MQPIQHIAVIPLEYSGLRFDQVAALLFADFSRAQLQHWIKDGSLQVDGITARAKDKVRAGSVLHLNAMPVPCENWAAQDLALNVVFEDDSLLVINKPAGLVVHPAAGVPDGTLLNALLHHDGALSTLPRAGIVHRLDKDTTGLLVVARTLTAHTDLIRQLQARTVKREYEAVACGTLTGGGTVDAAMGRHPRDRIKMAVVRNGKPAVTHFRLLQRFAAHTHIRVQLETGRTHQIRVHLAHLGFPLLGDPVYGARLKLPAHASDFLKQTLQQFRRQALHAATLGLLHPATGEPMLWHAPLPDDFQALLDALAEKNDDEV